MKKIIPLILSLLILFFITACSANSSSNDTEYVDSTINSESSSSNVNDSVGKTVYWMGNEYPLNVELDFNVQDMEYSNDSDLNVCYVVFCSIKYDEFSDNIDNYDFSNGPAELVGIIYDAQYNDVIAGNAKILGSYELEYTGKDSESLSGWQIMYDQDGEVIFKSDVSTLECGLHENYYDKNDNSIASYYGWDDETQTSLWKDKNGNLLNETDLRTLLKNMCPNDYLKNLI